MLTKHHYSLSFYRVYNFDKDALECTVTTVIRVEFTRARTCTCTCHVLNAPDL